MENLCTKVQRNDVITPVSKTHETESTFLEDQKLCGQGMNIFFLA